MAFFRQHSWRYRIWIFPHPSLDILYLKSSLYSILQRVLSTDLSEMDKRSAISLCILMVFYLFAQSACIGSLSVLQFRK